MNALRIPLCLLSPLSLIAACDLGERAATGDCPAGEVCSDATPRGLHFEGAELGDSLLPLGPFPTLAGGTQALRLTYDPGTGILRELDQPFLADDDGAAGVEIARTEGAIVTVRGVSSRTNYLRITDPDGLLYDRKQLGGATLAAIRIVPTRPEQLRQGEDVVFGPGAQELTVALFGMIQGGTESRVVDEAMAIALAGATREAWDTVRVPQLAAGRHAVTVTAGDRPGAAIDVEAVAGADAIVAHDAGTELALTGSSLVCFSAHAAGRHVAGLDWTFATDNGAAESSLLRNCAAVTPARAGALSLTATAGGQSLTAPFTVVAAPAARRGTPQPRPAPARPTSAGERAAAR